MKKTSRRSKQTSPTSSSEPNEKQIYEERIRSLETENKAYQIEIAELRQQQLGSDSSASKNGVEKLKKEYLQKLNLLEDQVSGLKMKLGTRSQFSTHRKKVDESTKQLQFEIQGLKAQKVSFLFVDEFFYEVLLSFLFIPLFALDIKSTCVCVQVQLQCKIKLESVQFRLCKALLEKEILQVLQRKTEEAFAATKILKDVIATRKAISHKSTGARSRNGQLIQDAEEELDVTNKLHKLCSQYESKVEKLELQEEECDSLDKVHDIQDLKEQMNSLDCLLRELQSRKEKIDVKDKKQGDLVLSHLSEETNDKIKMGTPEMSSASENSVKTDRTAGGLCCSCSKKSLCKTSKCKCRSSGGSCGASCGCTRFKCTNRESNQLAGNEPLKSNNTECSVDEDGSVIASECAKLLQSALVQKPASCQDNPVPIKKPLRDIQNSMVRLDDQKQGKKKRGGKPVIQLVTKDPVFSPPEHSSSTETYKIETQENGPTRFDKMAKPDTENNSGQSNEMAVSITDAPGFRRLRNPTR
ncbi:Kinesin-like protein [Vigna angularis]|uniref:Kinesin-like protein n=1 Tax=Phaseolus angularis TaxID=3914 RepID=A0A8T0KJX3_PHAAN|nr:Kinesin-like protein [Vigna angularis]